MDTEKYALILKELSPAEPVAQPNESVALAAKLSLWCLEGTRLLGGLLAALLTGRILPPSAYVAYAKDLEQQVLALKSMNDHQQDVIQSKNKEIGKQTKLLNRLKRELAIATQKSEADIDAMLRSPSPSTTIM